MIGDQEQPEQRSDDERTDHRDERKVTLSRSRDDSLAAVLELEPSLLGDELLVVGTSVLTATGDVADVVAVDEHAAVHVISVASGIADSRTVGGLVGLSAWARSFRVDDLRSIFAAYHEDETLEAAFERAFAAPMPGELAKDPYAVVVAAAFDDLAAEDLDALAGFNDHLRAWAYQEYIDAEDDAVYVMTNRLV